jgi:hypothetical protein
MNSSSANWSAFLPPHSFAMGKVSPRTESLKILDSGTCDLCGASKKEVVFEGSPRPKVVFVAQISDPKDSSERQLLLKMAEALKNAPGLVGGPLDVAILYFQGDLSCTECLGKQISAVSTLRPARNVVFGAALSEAWLSETEPFSIYRGRLIELQGIPTFATEGLPALLADPGLKRAVWEEMKAGLKARGVS